MVCINDKPQVYASAGPSIATRILALADNCVGKTENKLKTN